jgi:hypothetical protein
MRAQRPTGRHPEARSAERIDVHPRLLKPPRDSGPRCHAEARSAREKIVRNEHAIGPPRSPRLRVTRFSNSLTFSELP